MTSTTLILDRKLLYLLFRFHSHVSTGNKVCTVLEIHLNISEFILLSTAYQVHQLFVFPEFIFAISYLHLTMSTVLTSNIKHCTSYNASFHLNLYPFQVIWHCTISSGNSLSVHYRDLAVLSSITTVILEVPAALLSFIFYNSMLLRMMTVNKKKY